MSWWQLFGCRRAEMAPSVLPYERFSEMRNKKRREIYPMILQWSARSIPFPSHSFEIKSVISFPVSCIFFYSSTFSLMSSSLYFLSGDIFSGSFFILKMISATFRSAWSGRLFVAVFVGFVGIAFSSSFLRTFLKSLIPSINWEQCVSPCFLSRSSSKCTALLLRLIFSFRFIEIEQVESIFFCHTLQHSS